MFLKVKIISFTFPQCLQFMVGCVTLCTGSEGIFILNILIFTLHHSLHQYLVRVSSMLSLEEVSRAFFSLVGLERNIQNYFKWPV